MRVPIENKGQMPIYVAGVMIPPGETRHFEEDQIPQEFRQPAESEQQDALADPLLSILEANTAAVTVGLPTLSDEDLARLEALEAEGKNRKGVLSAIAAEKLARAERALAGGEG